MGTYSGSTLAVASSNTRILLLRSMALAKHINCLCPTLKLLPPSWTFKSKLVTADFKSTCGMRQFWETQTMSVRGRNRDRLGSKVIRLLQFPEEASERRTVRISAGPPIILAQDFQGLHQAFQKNARILFVIIKWSRPSATFTFLQKY
jgi:hypothetical protein